MVHELTQYDFELPAIEDAFAGDSRTLAFQVVDADGSGVDISGATVLGVLSLRGTFHQQFYTPSSSSNALASWRSTVSKPSVNQP